MFPLYKDIRTRLGKPSWIDKHGCPRYGEFSPENAREIYDDWLCLMTIECQSCGRHFQCVNSFSFVHEVMRAKMRVGNNFDTAKDDVPAILDWLIGWGDAPWHDQEGDECGFDGQCAGTTMSTSVVGVQAWRRDRDTGWVEIPTALLDRFIEDEIE